MKIKLLILITLTFLLVGNAFAQNGGKAEPNRISFAKGKSSATMTDSLKTGQEYEYVFGAKEGQKVKLKIVSTTPKGKFHAFRMLGGDGVDFTTEYDSNFEYEFTIPTTGDYLVFVSFNATDKVRSGKFALTLAITN